MTLKKTGSHFSSAGRRIGSYKTTSNSRLKSPGHYPFTRAHCYFPYKSLKFDKYLTIFVAKTSSNNKTEEIFEIRTKNCQIFIKFQGFI